MRKQSGKFRYGLSELSHELPSAPKQNKLYEIFIICNIIIVYCISHIWVPDSPQKEATNFSPKKGRSKRHHRIITSKVSNLRHYHCYTSSDQNILLENYKLDSDCYSRVRKKSWVCFISILDHAKLPWIDDERIQGFSSKEKAIPYHLYYHGIHLCSYSIYFRCTIFPWYFRRHVSWWRLCVQVSFEVRACNKIRTETKRQINVSILLSDSAFRLLSFAIRNWRMLPFESKHSTHRDHHRNRVSF